MSNSWYPALGALAVVFLAGCGAPEAASLPAGSVPPPATASTPVPPTGSPDQESPQVGVSYPVKLYSHCGIDRTTFGGRRWKAVKPLPDPARLPSAGYTGYVSGTMTLVDPELLRFTLNDPAAEGAGRVVEFMPDPDPPTERPCA